MYINAYIFPANRPSSWPARKGSRMRPLVVLFLFAWLVSVSVCVDLCGWPCVYVQYLHVFVCVPIGDTHSTLLLAGPGDMELQAAAALLMWGYWIWQPLTILLHKPRECFLFPALLESIHSLPTCSCSRHDHTRQNKPSNISVVFKKSVKPESFAAWSIQLCSKANSLNVTFYPSALCLIYQCTWTLGYIQNSTGQGPEQPTVI